MKNFLTLFSIALLCGYCNFAIAGGPLILEGPDGNTPVIYQNPDITVNVEEGDLGLTSNAGAKLLLQNAFALWNNVSTSAINLIIDESQINVDIDINNFDNYLPNVAGSEFNADDNLNPIVYDSNGEIIDAFFGANQSDTTIGFAASIFTIGASYFSEGYAVINGKDLGLSTTDFTLLIAHEIGHFFGLDHTQVNIDNTESDIGSPAICTTTNRVNYPVMYPFVCRDEESLHSDDVSAVSALYPDSNVNSSFGILQGRFADDSGNAVLGANIWAEDITTGAIYSIVSDYLKQGTGFYKLLLPAGSYTLHANSINPIFNGGSGIGPYALSIFDLSFISPHPIAEVTYQDAVDGNDKVVTISTDQTVTINFSITGNDVNFSSDDDDSFSDLFGSTSYLMLLLLLGLLVSARLMQPNHSANTINNS